MHIITIANHKGGVGKTTTAGALAVGLKERGAKTLLIDMDASRNLSFAYGVHEEDATIIDVLKGSKTISEAVQHAKQSDIIAGSHILWSADPIPGDNKEYRLKSVLAQIEKQYDYIIIDVPPMLSILTINAIIAATDVIITVQPDAFSLQGLGDFGVTLGQIKANKNPELNILGILVVRYNPRAILTRDITKMLSDAAKVMKTKVFHTKIRECIAIKEAQMRHESIYTYASHSNGAMDYNKFIDEMKGEISNGQ